MDALELKKLLIHRIAEINDVAFLNAIKTILDTKSDHKTIVLSSEQRSEILASKKEIEEGNFIEEAELTKAFNNWLCAK